MIERDVFFLKQAKQKKLCFWILCFLFRVGRSFELDQLQTSQKFGQKSQWAKCYPYVNYGYWMFKNSKLFNFISPIRFDFSIKFTKLPFLFNMTLSKFVLLRKKTSILVNAQFGKRLHNSNFCLSLTQYSKSERVSQ